jgi:AcrR family transcriptional regulator
MARTPQVKDRREQIVQAALRVFAQKGFDRATNQDIADEAGITPGLIYHYFKSKQDLLKAAIEGFPARQFLRSLPKEMLALPPEALLRSMAMQILQVAGDDDVVRVLRIYLPEVIHNPALSSSGSSTILGLVQFLEKALAVKMKRGELRRANAGLAAQLFVGSLLDIILRRQILREPLLLRLTQDEIVDGIVSLTLQGLLPR